MSAMTITREEILKLAREASCGHESMTLEWIMPENLEAFSHAIAARAAEVERSACANIAYRAGYSELLGKCVGEGGNIYEQIRARKEQTK